MFKLNLKAKSSYPSSKTNIVGTETKDAKGTENSSLVKELDEKLKSFKKIKDK